MLLPEKVRNVALVGHGGSGKTTLAEALLFVGGATNRRGTVEQGTTVLDFEPEEVDRGISLGLGVATFNWNEHRINLIDTPGSSDFSGDARAALRAVDLALFVVSGVDGVEVQTEQLWKVAEEEGIPRAVVVTKLDRDRSSFERTLDQLRDSFGKAIAPIQVPIGSEEGLRGLVRVASERAYEYAEEEKEGKEVDLPSEVEELVHAAHTALVETVVETDDEMMEAYFEGKEPSREQIVTTIHKGIVAGDIQPVLVASAERLIGIDLLAEFIVDYGPNPLERILPTLTSGDPTPPSPDGPTAAFVFKSVSDPFVGRISLFRIYSGTVKADQELDVAGGGKVRLHNLFKLQGKEHNDVPDLPTGGIGAVAKVDNLRVGDTLRSSGSNITIAPISYPRPVAEVAITPRSHHDEEKLSTALHRIEEEDPTIRVERRSDTGETILAGLGDTHLDVTVARIHRKFGVEVDTALPIIPYRETITTSAQAEGKHKKQSGGRGQFGVALVKFAPLPRGSGYEYIDSIKGGSIPRQFIPAVDKGIQEALNRGVLAGYPVIDISAEVYDGKYHAVDSDEMSFRMAGIQAVRAAIQDLKPILLEPVMKVTVTVPEDHLGDVMGDINSKRGKVLGMEGDGTLRSVIAEVPMAEIQQYAAELRSLTSGRGSFDVEFDHYAEVPHNEAQQVIAASRDAED
ncbi:MAG: elongation factor [Acidimicrobiia bacterium]|jgi:elongation factor G|nr:elongation factor [Acidimicrobiia bacterium]